MTIWQRRRGGEVVVYQSQVGEQSLPRTKTNHLDYGQEEEVESATDQVLERCCRIFKSASVKTRTIYLIILEGR